MKNVTLTDDEVGVILLLIDDGLDDIYGGPKILIESIQDQAEIMKDLKRKLEKLS